MCGCGLCIVAVMLVVLWVYELCEFVKVDAVGVVEVDHGKEQCDVDVAQLLSDEK